MKKYNVTIIDDNLIEVLTLKKILADYCLVIKEINYCLSIEEGILEVERNKPDIIFLDIMFDDALIFDFFHLFSLEDVAIVFISSERNFALNAFEKNAVDFVLKPFVVESVILSFNRAVRSCEATRQINVDLFNLIF